MLTDEEIENRTGYHPPTSQEVIDQHQAIREATTFFIKAIRENTLQSREQSIAITAAEEAMMWSNAAIARNQGVPF